MKNFVQNNPVAAIASLLAIVGFIYAIYQAQQGKCARFPGGSSVNCDN